MSLSGRAKPMNRIGAGVSIGGRNAEFPTQSHL